MKIRPRAEVEAAWQAREAERRGTSEPKPAMQNIRPALYLTGPLRIPFRGRLWTAHVSFDDGVRAVDIAQRIERVRKGEDTGALIDAVRDAERLANKLLRPYPERWYHKVLRALGLTRSPVRDWTEQEVGELIGFFLLCRRSSRVGGWTGPEDTDSTSSTNSRISFGTSPRGVGQTASR